MRLEFCKSRLSAKILQSPDAKNTRMRTWPCRSFEDAMVFRIATVPDAVHTLGKKLYCGREDGHRGLAKAAGSELAGRGVFKVIQDPGLSNIQRTFEDLGNRLSVLEGSKIETDKKIAQLKKERDVDRATINVLTRCIEGSASESYYSNLAHEIVTFGRHGRFHWQQSAKWGTEYETGASLARALVGHIGSRLRQGASKQLASQLDKLKSTRMRSCMQTAWLRE